MKKIEEIRKALEERKDRSAWNKGVTVYALELLEVYEERAKYEGRGAEDSKEFREWIKNGADGCGVVYRRSDKKMIVTTGFQGDFCYI